MLKTELSVRKPQTNFITLNCIHKEAATIWKLVIFITQNGASSTPMGVGAVVNISNFVQMTHFCDNHYHARSFVLKTSSVQMKIKLTYM